MSQKAYRSTFQRNLVIEGVQELLKLGEKHDAILTKETLNFICEHYCRLVDAPDNPGTGVDDRYK